ncbi:helix-turn-helix domain-containing protein [Fibrella forsythiae]|uniref:AraC family transcriptional regulator n=1 Tax=Fibrella forsythiae TaxID=2817061 RepID=A0ABS3JNB4_9BACT|nr:AraC family transcriptional regulator [Fibrella forsythiae]MBO0951484.1 AraC family transcriptional regulator [Fibrella forsythiae]
MLVHYFPPSPALREYVRLFQIVHFVFDDKTVLPVKPYWPRPEHCLAFYTRHTETVRYVGSDIQIDKPRSALIGQPSIVTNRHVGREFLLFQVVFQPGALFRLTGLLAHELTNRFLDAETVFGAELRLVNERLNSTASYTEMTSIVETFMYYLIARRSAAVSRFSLRPIDKVSRFMLDSPSQVSLDWLAGQACLSTRQFYENFMHRTGISPKLYSRIIRFDSAMRVSNAQPNKDWLSIALEVGYHDYQHMVRDFREFTSLTPTEFSRQESQAPERAFGIVEK